MSQVKFNFAQSEIKSTDELNKILEDQGQKHFRQGRYKIKIVKAEFQAMSATDKTWAKYLLTYEGAGGRTITDQIQVPTSKITFSGKNGESLGMFKRLQSFMNGLGVSLTVENLGDTLTSYFTDVSKALKGKEMTVDIGYRGNYISYEGKNEDGSKKYVVKLRDGQTVGGVYPDWHAAKGFADAQKPPIEVAEFVDVVGYAPGLAVAGDSNW